MQKSKNIVVIGGGPIGCYAAHLLSKSGHEVTLFEEHKTIGSPIQCTGLLTSDFNQFNFSMDSFLVNTFENIQVNSPNNQIKLKQKEYLVCRTKFDQFFANLAKSSGAKILTLHSFLRKEGTGSKPVLIIKDLLNNKEKSVRPDIVIAADGPLSKTAKAYGFYHKKRKNYFGLQALVKGEFDDKTYQTFFGKELCPDLFAWVVPESKTTARVGLASKSNSKKLFDNFTKKHNFEVKEMQAGTIPLYHPNQKLKHQNCYILGDAASFVKATTLGGLVPSLKSAQILSNCINKNKNYSKAALSVKKGLWLHLRIRKILDKFSDNDWDRLVKLTGQRKVGRIFEKYSRDNPIPLATNLILREPRFLYFLKYLI